jgi:uncharacterized protein YxjI
VAEVRKRLLPAFRERFTIDVHGADDMEIDGDLLSHEFTTRQAIILSRRSPSAG